MAAPSSERTFRSSLKTRSFFPIYYLHGDDEYLKEDALRQLLGVAVDPATRDFNLDVRAAAVLDAESVGSLLGTPPMMADRRVVVFRDVGALKKDSRAALDQYVERVGRAPAGAGVDVVLVLVAQGGEKAKTDRALESLPGAARFDPLAGDRVPKWIVHHVTSELGARITPEAVALLTGAVGNDLGGLAAELEKLVSYASGGEIDEEAVAAVVGVRRGETLGDLLDRVAARDTAGAMGMLSHVLEQPKTTAVSIVMALTTQALALAYGVGLLERGVPRGRLVDAFKNDFLKAGSGAFTGRPWHEAATAWAGVVDRWDGASLDNAFAALLCADVALKETRLSTDDQILATLVLSLCGGAGRVARSA